MNQARSGRYYPDDFEPKAPIPWMTIFALAVFTGILCAASAYIGHNNGFERGRAYQASLAKPACSTLAPATALTQWSCSAQERKEYLGVCLHRMKRAEVK